MTLIKTYPFNKDSVEKIKNSKYGTNWPVVYIIRNEKEAYIGESSDALQRTKSHLANQDRVRLKEINIICNDKFNKSAILDLESLLIQHMTADRKYELQNIQLGQSKKHNYYQKQYYLDYFNELWKALQVKKIVNQDLEVIRNSDIFKYSPYKELTEDQYETVNSLLSSLLVQYKKKEDCTYIINGGAGTGKTVLAIYLTKTITNIMNNNYDMSKLEDLSDDLDYEESPLSPLLYLKNMKKLDIALVIPMQSLRKTLKKVFSSIKGLKASMVIGPSEVVRKKYDLLIVDEAHRLRRKVNLMPGLHSAFKKNNQFLNLKSDSTELDWILSCSQYQILFYDKTQSVKPSDVRREDFLKLYQNRNLEEYKLISQLRVKGGIDYIEYINRIMEGDAKKGKIENYELILFDDLADLFQQIKINDGKVGLCRVVAGYSWPWKTKAKRYEDCLNENLYDISIEDLKLVWNTTDKDWVNSKNAINEIGCIHTIQGYDLNYAGVILGKEITYDEISKKIVINKDNYYDISGKKGIKEEQELKDYIINIYKVLLTRDILGTYVYVCDEKLKRYLEKLIEKN